MAGALANRLQHQVYLQDLTRTPREGGGAVETWEDSSGPIWAAVEPLAGSEALRGLQVAATVTHRITIRYREGVTPVKRVRFGARYFDVKRAIDTEERHERIELLAEEVVG
jgi:SPP1 family predicted phage head-tail adaptor